MATEKEITFETETNVGAVKIAEEVIVTIAGQGLSSVSGVSAATTMAEGIVDKLVKKPVSRGIRIYLSDEEKQADLDVHINVNYGLNIPEVCWAVQEAVKKNVESMTDIAVQKVNVFVDGLLIEKEPKPAKPKRTKKEEVAEKEETDKEE